MNKISRISIIIMAILLVCTLIFCINKNRSQDYESHNNYSENILDKYQTNQSYGPVPEGYNQTYFFQTGNMRLDYKS